ncbi:acylneuraminate cytidylyltransferase [Homoserinibacter sp. YIM 151385]|uniref:acylneuraminate cytidylyltransferase n=1 Tax=Homoserinibacter sp. YIM 151385 TaxID=2985506 RepID=UPI0022EFDDFD|nr:acylneuraminate cytidylyltransferase [Homoserinibacter sp. YIM 151385]WBU37144.1 acylneuraminate cytidylyltransferase [Homoserinibacter sp. YIM 151385]
MSVIAVIPARGGSKGVPFKNLRTVGGVPLIARAVRAALAASAVDRVIVSTDDLDIATAALAAGAEVVDRPEELADDGASSESALLHALEHLRERGDAPAGQLVFLQATSPFIDPAALDDAVRRVRDGEEDVVFSAVETHVFLWRDGGAGATGVNHDAAHRPRRQDREPHYAETGAFYVMDAAGFRAAGHRFFGRVGIALVDPRGAVEIDDVDDLDLAEAIAPVIDGEAGARADTAVASGAELLSSREQPIDAEAVVTDFDGVHTDDRVIVSDDGHEYVIANRADGMGVRLLREAGVPMLILSTEVHSVVAARARKLQVDVIHGSDDKAAALQYWAEEHGVDLAKVAYLGNDVNDLGCLDLVGWPVSVADANPEVRAASRIVLQSPGGHGAVRELADRVLRGRADHRRKRSRERAGS